MVTIAELPSLGEAYVLKSLMEAEDITVLLPDEEKRGKPLHFRVQVGDENAEQALAIADGFPNALILYGRKAA